MEVRFYDTVPDEKLKFAVIVAQYKNKWVFCKHKERNTYEVPGGHREINEKILDTAKRELFEETGAEIYDLIPVCVYSVIGKNRANDTGEETFGKLYYANIIKLGKLPESEMERVCLFSDLPTQWTYPDIQPKLMEKISECHFAKHQNS